MGSTMGQARLFNLQNLQERDRLLAEAREAERLAMAARIRELEAERDAALAQQDRIARAAMKEAKG